MPASMNPETGKITHFDYTTAGKREYQAALKSGDVPVRGRTAGAMNLPQDTEAPEDFLNKPNTYGG